MLSEGVLPPAREWIGRIADAYRPTRVGGPLKVEMVEPGGGGGGEGGDGGRERGYRW